MQQDIESRFMLLGYARVSKEAAGTFLTDAANGTAHYGGSLFPHS
jgi:hypothetical protein